MKHIEVVAAVIAEGDLILSTQRGYGSWKGWWEFPGGKIEPGESHEEALIREIKEELDIEIKVGRLLTTIDYDYPDFHLTMHCYWSRIASGTIKLLEHDSARWLSRKNLNTVEWLPADIAIIDQLRNLP